MRYRPTPPPTERDRFDAWLVDQLRLIGYALDALYNGEQENTTQEPDGDEPVLIFSNGDLNFGDGSGLYLRLGADEWYSLQMSRVHPLRPQTAQVEFTTEAPTIS